MQKDEQQLVFDGWLRNHQGLFFKVVRAYAFTPQDQEDLFQEIATQVWRSIPGFRGDAGATTWNYRVALNAAIAWTQKERRHRGGKQGLDGQEKSDGTGAGAQTCAGINARGSGRGYDSPTTEIEGYFNEMQQILSKITMGLALTAISALAQTKPAFEVATIKPAPPMDVAKIAAALQAGGKMPIGANVDSLRAEYRYLDLRSLMSYAYGVKPYQITGPDWMATTRFDIVAKMPEGSKKEDAPKMLQALLEERFMLATHRASAEHPVLALVVGKGGPKLKASAEKPVAIDENAPLKPGELKMDGSDGPMRIKIDMTTGGSGIDMGLKGKMSYRLDPATRTLHVDFSMTTMAGFADMITQLFTQLGGTGGKQVVDMTGIQGNYDATIDLSLAEIMAMVRAAGVDIPAGGPAGAPGGAGERGDVPVASDPGGGGGSSLTDAVQSMGLKLESRKAMVDQLIVDHIEKTPTEN